MTTNNDLTFLGYEELIDLFESLALEAAIARRDGASFDEARYKAVANEVSRRNSSN